ncbi:hypothetical protein [Caballeronia sp. ATUFL_M2_KS44]|uniref:hypothetical protein n=1 Tax=Caballeronia sp. ATUFL_M2_KS44 TaxID=2921767 RepID=UPI0020291918
MGRRKVGLSARHTKTRVCTYQVSARNAAIGVMDPIHHMKPHGAFAALMADQDLAHLQRVMRRSLSCDLGGPLLPPSYWRERLAAVTRQSHLSPTQVQIVHRLYLYIDAFETASAVRDDPPIAAAGGQSR